MASGPVQDQVTPFGERLVRAAAILDRRHQLVAKTPEHVLDQWAAAGRDARDLLADIASVVHAVDHVRHPDPTIRPGGATGEVAVVAAILGCEHRCCHVRRGQAGPALFDLPGRRASCFRCARTRRHRVVPDDVCDVCYEQVPDNRFWPLAAQLGSAVVIGNMCRSCALLIHPEMVTS